MHNCRTCKEYNTSPPEHVPYIVYKSLRETKEKSAKRFIAIIMTILLLWACTIGVFVWYLNQYDFSGVDVDVTTDGGGDANYIGQDGQVINGTNPSEIQSTP